MGKREDRAVAAHLEHLRRRNLRMNTILLRKRVLRRFQMYLGPSCRLLEADATDIRDFLSRLSEPQSRATELSQLRGFFGWCVEEGFLDIDPTVRVERPRLQRGLPRPIPDVSLRRALASPPARIKPWLWLAAYGGLRAFDIANLRGENVLLHRTPPMLVMESKGGKIRTVPISKILATILVQEGLPPKGWCFPKMDGTPGPVTPHLVSKLCNEHLHDLGIADTLHSLRHWFGTKAYVASGRDLRATQELLGHENANTTQLYTWVDPVDTYNTVEGLPSV